MIARRVLVMTCAALAISVRLIAADLPETVVQAEQQRIAAIAKAVPSAVAVFTPDGNGGGSGVVISPDGYAVSNFHVTSPVGDYMKCGMADGKVYDAVIVGIDPTGDLALIKLLGREDFPAAEMANSDEVSVGDWCFAVGNPFLLATDLQPTVTFGIVSGVHRYQYPAGSILEYADCIQTDAAINPGNSGGPLFNHQGNLIGIVGRGSFEKRGRVNVGVGYAISINQVKNFLGHLRSGRIVDHATLGATVAHDENGNVVVSNILDTSDAFARGLRYGDEIIAFGGRNITSVNAFKNVLGIFPQGWRVPLSYRREGQRYDVFARLEGVHTQAQLMALLQRQQPAEVPPEGDQKKPDKNEPPSPAHGNEKNDVEVPPEAAKLIKRRPGFKNFHFNEINAKRVWSRFVEHGDFLPTLDSVWEIRGDVAAGGDVAATLANEESSLQFPNAQAIVTESKDLNVREQLEPADTGILLSLHLWRRMLVLGPEKYGDVYYVGTSPIPGRDGLFDVLSATRNVSESLFYFEPATGRLAAVEVFPDSGADPCEMLFEDYRQVAGRDVPHRIIVRRGAETIAEIRVSEFTLGKKKE